MTITIKSAYLGPHCESCGSDSGIFLHVILANDDHLVVNTNLDPRTATREAILAEATATCLLLQDEAL